MEENRLLFYFVHIFGSSWNCSVYFLCSYILGAALGNRCCKNYEECGPGRLL